MPIAQPRTRSGLAKHAPGVAINAWNRIAVPTHMVLGE